MRPRGPLPPLAAAMAIAATLLYAPSAALADVARSSTVCDGHTFGRIVEVFRTVAVVQSANGDSTLVRVPTDLRLTYVGGAAPGLRSGEFVWFAHRPGHPYAVATNMTVGARPFLVGPTMRYRARLFELQSEPPGPMLILRGGKEWSLWLTPEYRLENVLVVHGRGGEVVYYNQKDALAITARSCGAVATAVAFLGSPPRKA